MDPNDISDDPYFKRGCEEEFSDITYDCYESPNSAPGRTSAAKNAAQKTLVMTAEPDDSPKNEHESSIYPGSTFSNGDFDALL